jgi:hypothetical protein
MSREVESVETTTVFDLAVDAVIAATRNGGMIAADVEARRLLDGHPDCQIRFDELRDANCASGHAASRQHSIRPELAAPSDFKPRRHRNRRQHRPRVGAGVDGRRTRLLCPVHRSVRVLDERRRIAPVVGKDAQTNAGTHVESVICDGMGRRHAFSIFRSRIPDRRSDHAATDG